MSWSTGIEITESLFSYFCGIMLGINIKRYLKITHIFSSAVWHLPREVSDLAIERLNKVRRLKKQGDWREFLFFDGHKIPYPIDMLLDTSFAFSFSELPIVLYWKPHFKLFP